MASDGGPMYPCHVHLDENVTEMFWPGASIRDGFAMAISSGSHYAYLARGGRACDARDVYDLAQSLTDEKLRRDQADRDEGTPNE